MKPMRVWIGLVFVALGVLGLLDVTDVLDAGNVIGNWWPVAIIGLAALAMIAERRVSMGPVILLAIGALLLADTVAETWDGAALVWALIAIGLGLWVIFGRRTRPHPEDESREGVGTIALFSGAEARNSSEHFRHADVSAVFGGATLDLRDAHPEPGATVDAFALFGGVDVIVPEGWRVHMSGIPLFGGYEDKTKGKDGPLPPDAPELKVVSTAIFGGVDVKNTKR